MLKYKEPTDIRGQRFGKLTIRDWNPHGYRYTHPNGKKQWKGMWRCVCDCGKECLKATSSLHRGTAKSCGCLMQHRKDSLVGKRFGNLVVVEQRFNKETNGGGFSRRWLVACDCGNKRTIMKTFVLRRGLRTHCGCKNKKRGVEHLRPSLQVYRQKCRVEAFARMRRLMSDNNLEILTSLEEFLSYKNSVRAVIELRCHAGHSMRVAWPNMNRDPQCRGCRRLRRTAEISHLRALQKKKIIKGYVRSGGQTVVRTQEIVGNQKVETVDQFLPVGISGRIDG